MALVFVFYELFRLFPRTAVPAFSLFRQSQPRNVIIEGPRSSLAGNFQSWLSYVQHSVPTEMVLDFHSGCGASLYRIEINQYLILYISNFCWNCIFVDSFVDIVELLCADPLLYKSLATTSYIERISWLLRQNNGNSKILKENWRNIIIKSAE